MTINFLNGIRHDEGILLNSLEDKTFLKLNEENIQACLLGRIVDDMGANPLPSDTDCR